jgi:hypothetical protein
MSEPNVTVDRSDDELYAIVGRAMAKLEMDCSKDWPQCPRMSVLCDCRLRAVNAVNALKLAAKQ